MKYIYFIYKIYFFLQLQQQLVRVVTAQGMQLQGITPTFFAVPNGFPPAASPVIRHTPSSPAPCKFI